MALTASTLQRLAALRLEPEAMSEILSIIAEMQAVEDERRAKDRARKKPSTENPRKIHGNGAEIPAEPHPPKVPPAPPSNNPLTPSPQTPNGVLPRGAVAKREDFERFKAVYPKRKGTNSTEDAWQRFRAAVKSGADPEDIISGARRYAAEQQEMGRVGTEFVKQMGPWIRAKLWQDYPELCAEVEVQTHVWIGVLDPRWSPLAGRFRIERGKDPPRDARGGWPFPREWLDSAA